MDRKEKIYEELKSYSGSGEAEGLDAQQLAELTGIDRANVSRKLNELEREGRVIKLSGRPVRYMEREVYDKCQEKEKKEPSFFFMIGQEGSLKKQIELFRPDAVEIMPGVMPKILKIMREYTDIPLIAGGLLSDKKDVMAAFEAGVDAISATNEDVICIISDSVRFVSICMIS